MEFLLYICIRKTIKLKHMTNFEGKLYIHFSLDFEGDVESVTIEQNDEDITHKFSDLCERMKDYSDKLESEVDEFLISEEKTIVDIFVENNRMTIKEQYFNSPKWDDYDEIIINDISFVPF